MSTVYPARRPRSRKTDCANAAPRTPAHHTLPAGLVKALAVLASQLEDLLRQLDALHAKGDYSSERHAALCEVIVMTQRALDRANPARNTNPTRQENRDV